MADTKLFAGPAIRRLRRERDLTQIALADGLDISASYLNLIERNQRPLTAPLLMKLAARFDVAPSALQRGEPGGGVDALRRRLADPLFAEIDVDRREIEDMLSYAPSVAEAFARLFDEGRAASGEGVEAVRPATRKVSDEVARWRNHYADLDAQAEALADELRLQTGDLYAALAERLRTKHELSIRVLPADVLPGTLRRLDLHARQLQLSEWLSPQARTFHVACQLALLEQGNAIEKLVSAAGFGDRSAEILYRRHLVGYFAAALMMPYGRFLRACEASGYDIRLLERRFGASFEQVAHRLTTLQRVGQRGLPFFLLRIDRAGIVSKRFPGGSESQLALAEGRCPLWSVHRAFDRPGDLIAELVTLEDGGAWFTLSGALRGRALDPDRPEPEFALVIGLSAELARPLRMARRIDLDPAGGTPIGLGCGACFRSDCAQRSQPPQGRVLRSNVRERKTAAFDFLDD